MDIRDSQRIKEIRDNTRAMAEAFGRIADALAEALELYVSTQTETQNSNLTFEKRTMRDCYNCKRYESEEECVECKYEPKPCEWCKFYDGENCFSQEPCKVMLYFKDEPQTDCGDFADRLAYERGVKHAWGVAQKVFDSTVTFYEAEQTEPQTSGKPYTIETSSVCKDEPQTDCSWK